MNINWNIAGVLCAGAIGCAAAAASTPNVPEALRAPAGQELAMELLATGVQVYECASKADAAGAYEWKFKGPEATLMDRKGRPMGTHYGGPTWEAPDGSKVVAEVRARANAADAGAIPLLLLGTRSSSGDGAFSRVRSIQRLDTAGGIAPSEPCTARQLARVARVPYTATYYFYVEAR
jgi:hypothetical protein